MCQVQTLLTVSIIGNALMLLDVCVLVYIIIWSLVETQNTQSIMLCTAKKIYICSTQYVFVFMVSMCLCVYGKQLCVFATFSFIFGLTRKPQFTGFNHPSIVTYLHPLSTRKVTKMYHPTLTGRCLCLPLRWCLR